jgi:hypothetical protein
MKQMKGVIAVSNGLPIGFAAVVLLASAGMAQGSRPVPSRTVTGETVNKQAGKASARAGEDTKKGPKIRVKRYDIYRTTDRADFLDEQGRVVKTLDEKRGKGGRMILPAWEGPYVGVLEDPPTGKLPFAVFRYFDVKGKELWTAEICCHRGGSPESQVQVAEDGSVVLLLDLPKGARCTDAVLDDVQVFAPEKCAGLRVISAGGEELLRLQHWVVEACISPKSQYILVVCDERFRKGSLFHVPSRKLLNLPEIEGARLEPRIADDGIVEYMRKVAKHSWQRTAQFIPGKGLERLGEHGR